MPTDNERGGARDGAGEAAGPHETGPRGREPLAEAGQPPDRGQPLAEGGQPPDRGRQRLAGGSATLGEDAHPRRESVAWAWSVAAGLLWGFAPPDAAGVPLVLLGAVAAARSVAGDPVRDGLRGFLLGVLWYGASLGWLLDAWARYAGSANTGAWLALVAAQAAMPALASALAGTALARGAPRPLAVGLAWCATEALASVVQPLPAFPALLLVASPALVWPAAALGRAALSGVALAWGGTSPRVAIVGLGGWLLVGALWASAPSVGPPATGAARPAVARVGIVQPDVGPLDSRRASTADVRRGKLVRLIRAAGDAGADWVATPEVTWPDDPGDAPGQRRRTFAAALRGLPPVLIGATVGGRSDRSGEGEAPTNSLLAVDHGDVVGQFDKQWLVPVAESAFLGAGRDRYRPGTGPRALPIAGAVAGPLVCYEDMLPAAVRQTAADGADVLVAAAFDGWFGPGAGLDQHLSAARLAAVETGRFVVRPTSSGRSAVIDPAGRLAWQAPWVDADANPDAPGSFAVVAVPLRAPAWCGALAAPYLSIAAALTLLLFVRRTES